jgi:acetyl-CoA acyltransferase
MPSAFVVTPVRTPGTRARRGGLKDVRPEDLGAAVIRAVIERSGVDPREIDDVIMGCAFPEAEQGGNVARIAALRAEVPHAVPAQTVNRLCSSGLQAIASAAERIAGGFAECIVAGGLESMSMVPMWGNKFAPNPGLLESSPEAYTGMGMTAELVARKYGVGREEQDAFAAASHQRAARAIAEGRFADEIVPVEERVRIAVNGNRDEVAREIRVDDGVRADATPEALAKLKPVFAANGTVTAGNSSQMTDGAAAALVVSGAFLKRLRAPPLARFVSFAVRGVPPELMGIGPVEAIPAALRRAGIAAQDVDAIELNEAFAAQAIACMRELELDPAKVNPSGGAIALGHPLGATGAKLTATVLHHLGRIDGRYGVVSMCIGGGMGAAAVFERA